MTNPGPSIQSTVNVIDLDTANFTNPVPLSVHQLAHIAMGDAPVLNASTTAAQVGDNSWVNLDSAWTSGAPPVFTIPDGNPHSITLTVPVISGSKYFIGYTPTFQNSNNASLTLSIAGYTIPAPFNGAYTNVAGKILDSQFGFYLTATSNGNLVVTLTAQRIGAGTGTITLAPTVFGGYINLVTSASLPIANVSTGYNIVVSDSQNQMRNASTSQSNIAIGEDALLNNVFGFYNIAIGYLAGKNIVSGGDNLAIGRSALTNTVTGDNNVALGANALSSLVGGGSNVAVGVGTLKSLTNGYNNIGIGQDSGQAITTGSFNLAIGISASFNLTTGSNNLCFGYFAGNALTTGSDNTLVGMQAGQNNTGSQNVAIGSAALGGTGAGGENIAVGGAAGNSITSGTQNTVVGRQAGFDIATGSNNVAVGQQSGRKLTGNNNVAVGSPNCLANATGTYNIIIGTFTDSPPSVTNNWLNIGNLLQGWVNNASPQGLVVMAGGVGVNNVTSTTLDASALLQVESTTQGFLPPRMTTAQKNAISSPKEGLVVYDTTLHKLSLRTAAAWETVTSA